MKYIIIFINTFFQPKKKKNRASLFDSFLTTLTFSCPQYCVLIPGRLNF